MKTTILAAIFIFIISPSGLAEPVNIRPSIKILGFHINLTKLESVKTPDGFIVTPREVGEMKCAPYKYAVDIYADSTYYYLVKAGASPEIAEKYGIRINGKTGEYSCPKAISKYSLRCCMRKYSTIKKISDENKKRTMVLFNRV